MEHRRRLSGHTGATPIRRLGDIRKRCQPLPNGAGTTSVVAPGASMHGSRNTESAHVGENASRCKRRLYATPDQPPGGRRR